MPPLAKEYLAACIALRDKEQAEEERRHAAELDVTHKLLEAAKYRENMERQAKLEAEQESAAANQTSSNWRLTSIITGVIALFSVLRECKKISEPDVSGLNGMVKLQAAIEKSTFALRDAVFASTGRQLAVGGDDGEVHILSLDSGTEVMTLVGRPSVSSFLFSSSVWPRIESLDYAPNGTLIATGAAQAHDACD
jgi:WD40 repeat protein